MPHRFHFSTGQLVMLLLNLFVLGGCLVLLALTGPSGPLILLILGTLGMAVAKLGKARADAKPPRQGDLNASRHASNQHGG